MNTPSQQQPQQPQSRQWNAHVAAFVAVVALGVYVVTANSLAAYAWKSAQAQHDLASALEARSGLVDQQAALENSLAVESFALAQGMTIDLTPERITESANVAAR